jgi:uncharacterized membrane protein YhhN
MFHFPIDEPANSLVGLGLIAIPVLLIVGFVFGRYNEDRTRRTLRLPRMATSFILVVVALILLLSLPKLSSAALFIFIGMTLGFGGDLILAEVINVPNRLIAGIVAFGLGHVSYIVSFILASQALGLDNPLTGSVLWSVYIVLALILWVALIYSPQQSRTLNVGSLGYAWLIGLMAGTAGSLALQAARFVPLALGGLLFLISDVLLGNRELRGHGWFLVHDVVWWFYIAGQALIVLTPIWSTFS